MWQADFSLSRIIKKALRQASSAFADAVVGPFLCGHRTQLLEHDNSKIPLRTMSLLFQSSNDSTNSRSYTCAFIYYCVSKFREKGEI